MRIDVCDGLPSLILSLGWLNSLIISRGRWLRIFLVSMFTQYWFAVATVHYYSYWFYTYFDLYQLNQLKKEMTRKAGDPMDSEKELMILTLISSWSLWGIDVSIWDFHPFWNDRNNLTRSFATDIEFSYQHWWFLSSIYLNLFQSIHYCLHCWGRKNKKIIRHDGFKWGPYWSELISLRYDVYQNINTE